MAAATWASTVPILAKPATLAPTTFYNVLYDAIWDVFGVESSGTNGNSYFTIPGASLTYNRGISKVIRTSMAEPLTDTYWNLVRGFLAANGQYLDPTATQKIGSLTTLPAYDASGNTGTAPSLTASSIIGYVGARNLIFEIDEDPASQSRYIIIRCGPTRGDTFSAAGLVNSTSKVPGILYSCKITTAQNNAITFYDNTAASGSILGTIPANGATGARGVAKTVWNFNVPFYTGCYFSASATVPTVEITWHEPQ